MHRRGGKRIRLDDPPPEYENPMTPHHHQDQDYYNSGANSNNYGAGGEAPFGEQAGTSSDGLFESPPTPGMGRRMTRFQVVKTVQEDDDPEEGKFQVEQIFLEDDLAAETSGGGGVIVENTPQFLVPVVLQEVNMSESDEKHSDIKREVRLSKNREAARECRKKKKQYIQCLEERVAVLENQNKSLMDELAALKELLCQKQDEANSD